MTGGDKTAITRPEHVAIIMDGNGRWATQRGLPRSVGHKAGVEALRRTIRAACESGVGYLTVFGFSSENWKRPDEEVSQLMSLLRRFIRRDLAELHRQNVRIKVVGGRDGLEPNILALLSEAEELTGQNSGLNFVVAFNYGGRDEIARAAARMARAVAAGELTPGEVNEDVVAGFLDTAGIPDPDLVIRTSGEQRLSNFLTWQCAYSEMLFLDVYWPDFSDSHFQAALEAYGRRDRRFGGLEPVSAVQG
ncbi:MAG: di-trans,poly-cis-decaprenylcistransferase [Hyphomicrobiales bacterium]|nr:MAG: di-trans,poly-cis-decaprenylcistransferase [Hyphomicrobiales bacterium]